jgi:hypothetical protein
MHKIAVLSAAAIAASSIALSAAPAQAETGWIGVNSASRYGCSAWLGWAGNVQQSHVKCAGSHRNVKVRTYFSSCGTVTTGWRYEYNHADCRGGGADTGEFKLS